MTLVRQRVKLWDDCPYTVEYNGIHFVFRRQSGVYSHSTHTDNYVKAVNMVRFLGVESQKEAKRLVDEAIHLNHS